MLRHNGRVTTEELLTFLAVRGTGSTDTFNADFVSLNDWLDVNFVPINKVFHITKNRVNAAYVSR